MVKNSNMNRMKKRFGMALAGIFSAISVLAIRFETDSQNCGVNNERTRKKIGLPKCNKCYR
jgi:hypothetical protein